LSTTFTCKQVQAPFVCALMLFAVVAAEWIKFALTCRRTPGSSRWWQPFPYFISCANSRGRARRKQFQFGLDGEREFSQMLTEGLPQSISATNTNG
jgi:hypothetical protein